jgi:nicotinamide riboside transporter PnuC
LSAVEIAGVAANITAIILMRRQSAWGFVVAIAANAILAAYFVIIGLSGQAINRTLYTVMSAVSLASWLWPKRTGKPLRPTFVSARLRALALLGLALMAGMRAASGAGIVGTLDYVSLYLSTAAGLLIIRKKAEAWYFWLAMDAVNLPLYVLAGAHVNIFYVCFSLINDSAAARAWTREAKANTRR